MKPVKRKLRPGRVCAVRTCPKHQFRNVLHSDLLHKLPSNADLRRQWADLLGLREPLLYMYVCSLHFDSELYHTSTCKQLGQYGLESCNRACFMVPKGVLPSRNLPAKESTTPTLNLPSEAVSTSILNVQSLLLPQNDLKKETSEQVPLSSHYLLQDMLQGMEHDPEAELKLVWTEKCEVSDQVQTPKEDISSMCRLCAKVGLMMQPIFDSRGSELAKKINECLSFQVYKSDSLPLNICLPCKRLVLRMHQFYLQCKGANSKLRGLLIQTNRAKYQYVTSDEPSGSSPFTQIVLPPLTVENGLPTSSGSIPARTVPAILKRRSPAPQQSSPAAVDIPPPPKKQRTAVSVYPAVPEGTKTYSIYKFPDPKNLMRLPDFFCQYCVSSYYNSANLSKHVYLVHNKYLCPECITEHQDRTALEEHIAVTHNKPPTLEAFYFADFGNKMCSFCNTEFPTLKELRKHTYRGDCSVLTSKLAGDPWKLKGKSYECHICKKVYNRKFMLSQHVLMHLGANDYKCEICDKGFNTQTHLSRHKLVHSEELVVQCDKCGASFKHQKYLRQHMLTHQGRWNNKCTCCDASFRRKEDAEKHFKRHSKAERDLVNNVACTKVSPFECNQCGRHYKNKAYFEEHVQTHTSPSKGPKPHTCMHCGKCFSIRSNLRQHITRIHNPVECFQCDICQKLLKGKHSIALHVKSHLAPLVKCELCEMELRGRARVQMHMKRVHCEKRFCCEFCGKAFKMKKHLLAHIRVHTNERPFPCRHCHLAFKQWGDRAKHEAVHAKHNAR